MNITFHNVMPAPLASMSGYKTDIWETECFFEPGLKYNVVAPSGKGKSTFIHLIYGLRHDYQGEVKIDEQDVKSIDSDQWTTLRKDHISIVYQDLRLFLRLTAMENIHVKSALYKNIGQEKIGGMAELLNVAHVLSKPCATLSYGERQRIAIIRALIQPFDWLLLDEPFSHLDAATASKAANLIASEVSERKAGLIVTSLGLNESFTYDSKLQL